MFSENLFSFLIISFNNNKKWNLIFSFKLKKMENERRRKSSKLLVFLWIINRVFATQTQIS
jgi:hypothetical protein